MATRLVKPLLAKIIKRYISSQTNVLFIKYGFLS